MDVDSLFDDTLSGVNTGDFYPGSVCSFDDQAEQTTVPSVTPGASPLRLSYLDSYDDETLRTADDRTIPSLGMTCMSVGSHSGDHSFGSGQRGVGNASISSDLRSGIFSLAETRQSSESLASRHEAMRMLTEQYPTHGGSLYPSEAAVLGVPWLAGSYQLHFPPSDAVVQHSALADQNSSTRACSTQYSKNMNNPEVSVAAPLLMEAHTHAKKILPPRSVPKTQGGSHPTKNLSSEAKPSVSKAIRSQSKAKKEQSMINGRKIRLLIERNGTQHVYFGRGEPLRSNPGNIRFRNIVNRYHEEYQQASKKRKLEIRNEIEREVTQDGSKFIMLVETKGELVSEPAPRQMVNDKSGHALRDAIKRHANYWSWLDTSKEPPSWSPYPNKYGAALEQMYQEVVERRTKVAVNVRGMQHLVDVSSMIMHQAAGNSNSTGYQVRREEPEEDSISGKKIYVSDSDGQYDASSSACSSSTSQASERSSSTSSSRHGGVAGGVQSNMYCSLGMEHLRKTEITVSAHNASNEEILEVITLALLNGGVTPLSAEHAPATTVAVAPQRYVQDEDDDDVSVLHPPPRRTDVGKSGGLGSSLVKRLKDKVSYQIPRPFGKKKESAGTIQQLETGVQDGIWLWRENKTRMDRHSADAIFGDPKDCWIRYDPISSEVLEASYRAQNGTGGCSVDSKYNVDFGLMRQSNVATGFQRQVRRVESITPSRTPERGPKATSDIVGIVSKLATLRVQHDDDAMTTSAETAPTVAESAYMGLDDTTVFH